jgi:hypothetical protein
MTSSIVPVAEIHCDKLAGVGQLQRVASHLGVDRLGVIEAAVSRRMALLVRPRQ